MRTVKTFRPVAVLVLSLALTAGCSDTPAEQSSLTDPGPIVLFPAEDLDCEYSEGVTFEKRHNRWIVIGTPGNDQIDCGAGTASGPLAEQSPVVIIGLAGDDELHGGCAADRIIGGPGYDKCSVEWTLTPKPKDIAAGCEEVVELGEIEGCPAVSVP